MHRVTRFAKVVFDVGLNVVLTAMVPVCFLFLVDCGGSGGGTSGSGGAAIDYAYVDEANDQLHLVASPSARFLNPRVRIEGVSAPIVSWTGSEIITTIDRTGPHSKGTVDLDTDNDKTSIRLSAYRGTITEELQGDTNLLETATFTVRFRTSTKFNITGIRSFTASASRDATVEWNATGRSGNGCLVFSKNGTPNVPFYPVGTQPPSGQASFTALMNVTIDGTVGAVRVTPIASIFVPQGIKVDDGCTPKTYTLNEDVGFSVPTPAHMRTTDDTIPDGTYGGPAQGNTKVSWNLQRE